MSCAIFFSSFEEITLRYHLSWSIESTEIEIDMRIELRQCPQTHILIRSALRTLLNSSSFTLKTSSLPSSTSWSTLPLFLPHLFLPLRRHRRFPTQYTHFCVCAISNLFTLNANILCNLPSLSRLKS